MHYYDKKLIRKICIAIASVVLTTAIAAPTACNKAYALGEPTVLTVDANIPGFISGTTINTYKFTAPKTGFYVVETFGSTYTYGYFSKSGYSTENDNSGERKNFSIGFQLTKNAIATIKVKLKTPVNQPKSYSICVRKQKARIFTNNYVNYDGLNTYSQQTIPYFKLNSMGYETEIYNDCNAKTFAKFDNNFQTINCDVFYFAGHGSSTVVQFVDGSYINSDSLVYTPTNYKEQFSMTNTKLAIWDSCKSALPQAQGKCMTRAAVNAGAECSLGWTENVGYVSSKKWIDECFSQLADGKTVYDSACAADDIFTWPNVGCKGKWAYEGNGNVKLTSSKVYPKSMNKPASSSLKQKFQSDIKKYSFEAYDLSCGGKRYYKTVDGILTDDFYDVGDDGTIKHSATIFEDNELIKASETIMAKKNIKNIYTKKTNDNNIVVKDEVTVITRINGEVTPVRIVSFDILNSDGFETNEITCWNLNNNEKIDFSDICIVSYAKEADLYD